jgi:hypothetical protein
MSSQNDSTHLPPPLDLSGWAKVPVRAMVVGGILSVVGLAMNRPEFGYSWLLAFIFFLTISLGALFLVMVHHLTDAGWSVPIRRFCEHIASLLFPWLAILFLPVAIFSRQIYSWMRVANPEANNLIAAKMPIFTIPGFWLTSALFFAVWWFLSSRLSYWSLRQDSQGEAICTHKLRLHSGWGIVAFAITLTCSAVLWVKALQYQWYSAMFGVYFFASSVWIALGTVYVITVVLQRQRLLDGLLNYNQFYFIGVLFFGFTVFQAYIEFAQYFVVWNANIPTETFYYLIRENGNWWWLSMILIFGHFLVPFFVMLPVAVKSNVKIMVPVCVAAWFTHALDLAFNILPSLHNDGYPLEWIWLPLGCLLFQGGFLAQRFVIKFRSCPPYPIKDPRILEAMGHPFLADELAAGNVQGGHQ